jgi:hypothetical protein
MNKQQHYIKMDRCYSSSANRKTTMWKPMDKASSRLSPTTSQDSWLLFNPRKKICTTHTAFKITSSWLLVITAHCCLHWTQYPLKYCHNCTLLSSFWSTISWCTASNVQLSSVDPLSAGVLSSLHIAILTSIHLSAALPTLWHTVILIWIHYKLV